MVFLKPIVIITTLASCIAAKNMSGLILGGQYSLIKQFPNSAFLEIECYGEYACGASILNQGFLLSAAHCFSICEKSDVITAYVGDVLQKNGFKSRVASFRAHRGFSFNTGAHDIAVLRLGKELVFGDNVRRVILMRDPPYDGPSFVAGWGLIDDRSLEKSIYLKHTSQQVWNPVACNSVLKEMPLGCFCAENRFKNSYPSKGDSGSALVIRDAIQIGLVSHEDLSRPSLRVYTNVTHYLDWIQNNAKILNCKGKYKYAVVTPGSQS